MNFFRKKTLLKEVNVLFVCMGNICRSPSAQGVLENLIKDEFLQIGESEKKIRKALRNVNLPIQLLVEQIEVINFRLEDKQYFFADVKREGIELYNSGKHTLSDLPKEISPTVRREYAHGV